MDTCENATVHKLLASFGQFSRVAWRQSVGGYKRSEIGVLFCIKESWGASAGAARLKVSEISKKMQVTSPTVTQLVKGLEAHGLVERHIDPCDRRAVYIVLTEKGETVAQKAGEAFFASFRGLVEYLGEEQSNQFAELLSRAFQYFREQEANLEQSQWSGDGDA
jgi:DNA-binding MarR family transcriptional regulator